MQAASIKSLLATQDGYNFEMWLWLDEATKNENEENPFINQIRDKIKIKYYSPSLAREVPQFRRVRYLFEEKNYIPFRADGFRLYALNAYGGVYFDLDVMFLKNMIPLLLREEFVYAWEKQSYANNALIYLRKGSYVNETIAKKVAKIKSTQPWAVFNYADKKLKFLKLYGCILFDPLWNDDSPEYAFHGFDEFFTSHPECRGISPQKMFPNSFAYHWHNHWKSEIKNDSPFAEMERFFDKKLGF